MQTELANQQVVEQADVVIFALTIRHTGKAIRELVSASRPEQLWLDIPSLKPIPIP